MKKFVIWLLVITFIGFGAFYAYKNFYDKSEKINPDDWYVEITNDYINIREESTQLSNNLGRVNKGEKYLVHEINAKDSGYIWYKIQYEKDKYGWIANKKGSPYLKDYNNPEDVSNPTIKIMYLPYQAKNINSIGFENLEVWDDKGEPKITYEIYHEVKQDEGIDQYWILYTVTDSVGKTAQKLGSIEFETKPSEYLVKDFYKDYK